MPFKARWSGNYASHSLCTATKSYCLIHFIPRHSKFKSYTYEVYFTFNNTEAKHVCCDHKICFCHYFKIISKYTKYKL